MKHTRRGWNSDDPVLFGNDALPVLSACAEDICWLLDRGYPFHTVISFVGNRHHLTERQRTALMRMCASTDTLYTRHAKQLHTLAAGCTVHIDAFNAVILMETALSGSLILKGKDGCYRDLSGLAGTYAIIEATDPAITRILQTLQKHHIGKAVFWIDAPVSNSGRLKCHIADIAEQMHMPIDIRMVHDADAELIHLDHVISGDGEIITSCTSWYNLYDDLMADLNDPWIVSLW
jgi:hypothetical protein